MVPNGTAIFTNNGAPAIVTISNTTSINTMEFTAAVPAYSFTLSNGASNGGNAAPGAIPLVQMGQLNGRMVQNVHGAAMPAVVQAALPGAMPAAPRPVLQRAAPQPASQGAGRDLRSGDLDTVPPRS